MFIYQSSSHHLHFKKSIPYSQLLRIRRLSSVERDFQQKTHEICTFFRSAYCRTSLEHDLQRVSLVSRRVAIQVANVVTNGLERIPLVLIYHPLNNHIKTILLMDDETTKEIFSLPPLRTVPTFVCAHSLTQSAMIPSTRLKFMKAKLSHCDQIRFKGNLHS